MDQRETGSPDGKKGRNGEEGRTLGCEGASKNKCGLGNLAALTTRPRVSALGSARPSAVKIKDVSLHSCLKSTGHLGALNKSPLPRQQVFTGAATDPNASRRTAFPGEWSTSRRDLHYN